MTKKLTKENKMKILVACEESQAVTIELRKLGHEAYSCDIIECSGGHPEWHIQDDIVKVIKDKWDMIIAFPPCTHLAVSGARWFPEKIADGRQQQGIDLFMEIANADCERIAIENPVGIMSTKWKKPSQIVQPWMFGDLATKTTCLWIKGMPNLKPHTEIEPELEYHNMPSGKRMQKWMYDIRCTTVKDGKRAKLASKTFPGIAKAMAEQWTKAGEHKYLFEECMNEQFI
jgi:site-specific DNA-cytosine methylase